MTDRIVLDTNVIISAPLLPGSVARRAFDKAFTGGDVLASAVTLAELDRVLRRPKFERYVPEADRLRFLAALIRHITLVVPTVTITDCRDADDNMLLAVAVSGGATAIISGDADVLVLHPYRTIPVYTPAAFLALP